MQAPVAALLQRQHGVASWSQLKAQGWSETQIKGRLRNGEIVKLYRGVYRHQIAPLSWRGDVLAATLRVGGVASHATAARLLGMAEGPRSARIEVTVAHGRWREISGVTLHQSTQLHGLDTLQVDAIPCTGLGRTVLDLGACVGRNQVGAVIDGLVRTNRLTIEDLWAVWSRHARRGRDGCGVLREALELRSPTAPVPLSDWSRRVERLLTAAGLPPACLEFAAHDERGRFLAQIDLAYPSARLAIELDSVAYHHNLASFRRDRRRNRLLTLAGWRVLAFTWDDYRNRPDELIRQVASVLEAS